MEIVAIFRAGVLDGSKRRKHIDIMVAGVCDHVWRLGIAWYRNRKGDDLRWPRLRQLNKAPHPVSPDRSGWLRIDHLSVTKLSLESGEHFLLLGTCEVCK